MGFLDHVKIRDDVLRPELDERAAPSLGGVHTGKEEQIYSDPEQFFKRTILTSSMVDVLEGVASALSGDGGGKVIALLSMFGGGKTHTLLTIYHAIKKPSSVLNASFERKELKERVKGIVDKLLKLESPSMAVIDGDFSELAPNPVNVLNVPGGYRVQTVWGSLAHQLGRFGEVKENDEKLLVPQVDTLMRLFSDKPAIILIDEIAGYISKLKSSGDERLKAYAHGIIEFIDSLTRAVSSSSKAVLVITIPVSESEKGGLQIEPTYRASIADEINEMYSRILNRLAKRVVPVMASEVSEILRVRIFEEIDSNYAKVVSSGLVRVYGLEENKEVFGEGAVTIARNVESTYPYHPKYIETLVNLVDAHSGLQKTRDAIRITRKVVRKLYSEKSEAELIMPFHIDVEDKEIGGILLSHDIYRGYETVVRDDIADRVKAFEKPELAKAITKAIFLRTFVYGPIKQHRLYPDRNEACLMSYEPAMARAQGLQPKDYVDALSWLSKNLNYMVSEGGRYWFVPLPSPIRMIEQYAKSVDDDEALGIVVEKAKALLTRPPTSQGRGRREPVVQEYPYPFDPELSQVLKEAKPVDYDSRKYILLAVLSHLNGDDIMKLIYEKGNGNRAHANTIYLIFPESREKVAQMLSFAKLLKACEHVSTEGIKQYEEDFQEIIKKKIEDYCHGPEGVEDKLINNILSGLNQVAFPSYDEKTNRYAYGIAPTPTAASTIMEMAYRALTSVRKVYRELDFETLDYMLQQIGIKLSDGSEKLVSEVIEYFYSNPRLPLVREKAIKSALIDGVRCHKLGIKKPERVYFKRIFELKQGEGCASLKGDDAEPPPDLSPDDISPDDIVLSWDLALKEQLEGLKDSEERVAEGILRTRYAFCINGTLVPISEALEKYYNEILLESRLVKVTELVKEGVDIKLDRHEVSAAPGEEITINLYIERVGAFEGDVVIKADDGSVSPQEVKIGKGSPTASAVWRITAKGPGDYTYSLRALKGSGEELKSITVSVAVRPRGVEAIKGVPKKGEKLSLIVLEVGEQNLAPIKVLSAKFGSTFKAEEASLSLKARFGESNPEVELRLHDVSLDDIREMFPGVIQRFSNYIQNVSYKIKLRPLGAEYVEAPEFSTEEAENVTQYMSYYIFAGEQK